MPIPHYFMKELYSSLFHHVRHNTVTSTAYVFFMSTCCSHAVSMSNKIRSIKIFWYYIIVNPWGKIWFKYVLEWRSKWFYAWKIYLCLTAKVFEKGQIFRLQSTTCTASNKISRVCVFLWFFFSNWSTVNSVT